MKSNNSRYSYEAARSRAIHKMHCYGRLRLRYEEKFNLTGDIWSKYRGMYYKDMADRLAFSWNVKIIDCSMDRIEVRDLGV